MTRSTTLRLALALTMGGLTTALAASPQDANQIPAEQPVTNKFSPNDPAHGGHGAAPVQGDGSASVQAVPTGSPNDAASWAQQIEADMLMGGTAELCVCATSYEVGDVVVATVDAPDFNPQIQIGDIGVVRCGRFFDGGEGDLVLVEWDIDNGHAGLGLCDCPVDGALEDGATDGWYVRCSEIALAETLCTCNDLQVGQRVYAAVDNPQNNSQILEGDAGTVICGRFFGSGGGNDNLVLIAWDDIDNGHDGFGACDCGDDGLPGGSTNGWYVSCDEVVPTDFGCACEERFAPGDQVVALVDDAQFNEQIDQGTIGTVLCGRFFGENNLVLVEWPIDNGHDGFGACDCPTNGGLPAGSVTGWYVDCDLIASVDDAQCTCAEAFSVGDRVIAAVDNPQGQSQVFAGDGGTVICGRFFGGKEDLVLIKWDGIDSGHDGFGACDCGEDGLPAGSVDGWYVGCSLIIKADCSAADIDDDGNVGFGDLLACLSNFGDCFGCPADTDGSGDVNFNDVLAVLAAWGPCP